MDNKLTYSQYTAICGFINGLRKMHVDAYKSYDLSLFDESSYESTKTTFEHAKKLYPSLKNFMETVYNSRRH